MPRTGWFAAGRAQDWWDAPRGTMRTGDVTAEIADDPTSIAIMRGGADLDAQTVRLMVPRIQPGEAGSVGGEQATGQVVVLGTSTFDVQRADRFLVGSELYEVIYVAPAQASAGERVEAHCRQVQ